MLQFLGSGGAFHVARGNTSAYLELGGELILFDCGEDVFAKLVKHELLEKKSRVHIFITHLHSDHIGSLGTLIAYLYYKKYKQDRSNICLYYPNESICHVLSLQGVSREWYNFFINRWDELYIPGFHKQPEYSFYETTHTSALDYNGERNSYSIEFGVEGQFNYFYSGDTNQLHERLNNVYAFDAIYQEVTSIPNTGVHLYYEDFVEQTKKLSTEEKARFYLMHLDEEFDVERAKVDGYQIAQNKWSPGEE